MAAHLWNKTEGAGTVAPFGDLDVCVVSRRGENSRREVVIKIRLENIGSVGAVFANAYDLLEFIGYDDRVDLELVLGPGDVLP